MRFKIWPRLFLISGFVALSFCIKFQKEIKDWFLFNLEKVRILRDNTFFESSPAAKRHRPISLENKQVELKLYIGEPFRDFSSKDWEEFWDLIYGAFPREEPDRPGLPMKARHLTKEEIADELMRRYPNPFSFFKDSHWGTFFSIIFEK